MIAFAALWSLLTPSAAACEGSDLDAGAREVAAAFLTQDDAGAALGRAAVVEPGLACTTSLLRPEPLAAFFLTAGAAAMEVGDRQQANHWFGEACRLVPGAAWDVRLGTQGATAWEEERRGCELLAMGTVTARSPVWIDGVPLRTGAVIEVRAGWHYVQTMDGAGVVSTRSVVISGGQPVEVPVVVETPEPLPIVDKPRHPLARAGVAAAVTAGTAGLITSVYLTANYARAYAETAPEDVPAGRTALLTGMTFGSAGLIAVGAVGLFSLHGQF